MKKIFAAALMGASLFAIPAVAQDAPVAEPRNETIVPGNTEAIENNDAEERDAVASDPGEAMSDEPAGQADPIVPGSGATFTPEDAPTTQEGMALQDEPPTASGIGGTGMDTESSTASDTDDVLVPGSGATFTPQDDPESQAGQALQDEPPMSQGTE